MLLQLTTRRKDTLALHKVLTAILRGNDKTDTFICPVVRVTERNKEKTKYSWVLGTGKKGV